MGIRCIHPIQYVSVDVVMSNRTRRSPWFVKSKSKIICDFTVLNRNVYTLIVKPASIQGVTGNSRLSNRHRCRVNKIHTHPIMQKITIGDGHIDTVVDKHTTMICTIVTHITPTHPDIFRRGRNMQAC